MNARRGASFLGSFLAVTFFPTACLSDAETQLCRLGLPLSFASELRVEGHQGRTLIAWLE